MNGITPYANTISKLADTTKTTKATNNSGYFQSSSSNGFDLEMQDFLTLLVAQFQNQDIENPASTSDMLNQLMQMATIQSMTTMTDASTMTYAASLVGKEVTVGVMENGKLKEIVGNVTGTAVYSGQQVIFVDGKSYAISSIMAVGKLPPPVEDTENPDGTEKPDDTTKPDDTEKPDDTTKPDDGKKAI